MKRIRTDDPMEWIALATWLLFLVGLPMLFGD